MSNLTDLMRAEAEVLRLKSYRQIDDEAAVDLIHETRERALKAEAEVAALRWYAKHAPDCPMWGAVGDEAMCNCGLSKVLNAARAALKEGE